MFDNSEKCVFLQRIKYLMLNNMKKERYLEDDFNGYDYFPVIKKYNSNLK